MTTNDGHWSPVPSNAVWNTNGLTLSNTSWTDVYLDTLLTKPCSITLDLMDYDVSSNPIIFCYLFDTSNNRLFGIQQTTRQGTYTVISDVQGSDSNHVSYQIPKGATCRIEIKTNSIDLYVNNTLMISKSYTIASSLKYAVLSGSSRSMTIKNLKIKPL